MLVQNLPLPLDRRVWQEAIALRDAGFQVVAVCPQGVDRHTAELEEIDGIEIHRYPPRTSTGGAAGYLREYASAFRHMRRHIRRLSRDRRFDVVHAASPPDFLLLAALPLKRRGTRFVFDHHDLSPELYASRYGPHRGPFYRVLLAAEWIAYRLANVVIATNESYRGIALGRGGKDAADVFVVRNGPSLDRFHGATADAALRRGKRHLLAYVGMMGPQDGIDYALQALADLRTRRDDWHALFLGDGDVVPAMRLLTDELGLADAVTFGGMANDEQIGRALATADVCLSPEPSNPLNDVSTMIKVAEYMAAGRPIVAFDLPETRATAQDAALYARPNDAADFASQIDVLLSAADRREGMGASGRHRVERALSWDVSVRELHTAYDRLLPGRAPRVGTSTALREVNTNAVA